MSAEHDASWLRVPPHSVEAEQSVLGGLLIDNSALDRCADLLGESDFYRFDHQLIYAAIAGLVNASKSADMITVFERLESLGKAEECGRLAYLNALSQTVPSAANVRRYAEIVRDKARARALIAVLASATDEAFAGRVPVADQLDAVASAIGTIERRFEAKEPVLLAKLLDERVDRINRIFENGSDAAWPTHISWLDKRLSGGLKPSNLYVLAARPSVGKSSLAESVGTAMARFNGRPVLYLSQEMSAGELADRAIAELAGVDYGNIQTASLGDDEWRKLSESVDIGSKIPFYVDDTPALTLRQIRQKARRVPGLQVLILDYLQLSESDSRNRNETRSTEIGAISRGLKKLAKEMDIAVIALSQLNRKVDERQSKKPVMSDLRDSGEIEQDADVIMFLWPVKDFPTGDGKLVGLEIGKNRQGARGEVALEFRGKYQRWAESSESLKPSSGGAGADL